MRRWFQSSLRVGMATFWFAWTGWTSAQDPLPPDSHIASERLSPESMRAGTGAGASSATETALTDRLLLPSEGDIRDIAPWYLPENFLVDRHYVELQSVYWRAGSPKNQTLIANQFAVQPPAPPSLLSSYRADSANTDYEVGIRAFIGRRVTTRLAGEIGALWVYQFREPGGFQSAGEDVGFGGPIFIQPQYAPTSEFVNSIFFVSRNNYYGFEANGRLLVFERPNLALEALGGVRFFDYREKFNFTYTGTDGVTTNESFRTVNSLVGPQIGAEARARVHEFVSLRSMVKCAFTTNFSEINILGPAAGPYRLTSPETIGVTYDEPFVALIEMMFGGTLHLTPNVQLFGGYNLIWLSEVYRATSQVDTSIPPVRLNEPDSLWITGFVFSAKYVY